MNVIRWLGTGSYDVEVVGESFYQAALGPIAGDVKRKKTIAQLVCESDNKYDKNAVRVEISGATVGHLSRGMAVAHRQKLESDKQRGAVVECEAVVVTGRDGSRGVYLDLPIEEADEEDEDVVRTRVVKVGSMIKPPFVRRHFVALVVVCVLLLIAASSPSSAGAGVVGLLGLIGLGWYRWKRWK